MKYIPALDGLRGYAVLLVLAQHWLGNDHFLNKFNNGVIGVTLFYVLSGFLITGILLKNKKESSEIGLKAQLKNFWTRRILRIFPIYYLILLLLIIFGFQDIRNQFVYFSTYTQNILFYSSDQNFGYLIHFWSLAIEEQFYLIWPVLILLVRFERIPLLIALTIASGIFFRFAVHHDILSLQINPVNYHLVGSMDLFGYGAFLAFKSAKIGTADTKDYFFPAIMVSLILILYFIFGYWDYLVCIGLVSYLLLFILTQYSSALVNLIFCNRVIINLGKISYGVYLIHYFIYPLNHWLHEFCLKYDLKIPLIDIIIFPEFSNLFIRFFYFLLLTILLSFISWRFIEKPFLNLKSKFDYGK